MSFSSEYLKLRRKRLGDEAGADGGGNVSEDFGKSKATEEEESSPPIAQLNDIAPIDPFNLDNVKWTSGKPTSSIQGAIDGTNILDLSHTGGYKSERDGKWFNAGYFDDGYQFGDVLGTGVDTAVDLLLTAGEGAITVGEGVIDLLYYASGGLYDLFGAEAEADEMKRMAMSNSTAEAFDSIRDGIGVKKGSLLGDNSRDIARGLGQVGAMILTGNAAAGLGATAGVSSSTAATIGTTALMGTSSMGQGMSEAYQGGATDEEAFAYGLMNGVVNAGSELIFGGLGKAVNAIGVSRGISALDDKFAQFVSKKISNQFMKNGAEFLVKAGAEGTEEIIAGVGTAFAKKLTYMSDEDIMKLIEDEQLLDQFISGFVVSGIAQSGDFVSSVKNKTDFVTGYSQNEQAVIDKEIENRITEAEADGTKLTNKDKGNIEQEVIRDFEKGYISTNTIESVLGGEEYTNYQNELKRQEEIDKELNELRNMKSSEMTDIQQERMNELKGMVSNKDMLSSLKFGLDEKIRSTLATEFERGSYLAESYNEQARKGQYFEADLSKYDSKQAEIVQKAIDSKILNNSNRTHDFVDMVAKISADKGVLFDFTNNQKLKESGFAVDGKFVNGYVTKDGITVNMDSPKYVNTVVGHEITHILEGTELYTALQNTLFDYAKSKGEYDTRLKALTELYKGVKGADVNAELTADLVGDYLFTDSKFISHLSTTNRNVFQKIYDEIKYLYKMATAGSKEARQLEKVKKAFEQVYRESGKTEGTKYSLTDNADINKNRDLALEKFGTTSNFAQTGFVLPDGKMLNLSQYGQNGVQHKRIESIYDNVKGDEAISRFIQEGNVRIMPSAPGIEISADTSPTVRQLNAISRFISSSLRSKGTFYLDITDANGDNVASLTYNEGDSAESIIYDIKDYFDKGVVPDTRYSLTDTDGKKLTKEQSEYFKDSKMRDDNGNLKVMYHGSQDAGFHTFDANMSDDDTSFFFVDRNDVAASYSGTTETYEAKTIRTAEDMNNFLAEIGYDHYKAVEKDGKFELLENNEHVAYSDTAQGIYEEFCWYEGVGEGDANYKVYLNLTNPLVVDAEGRNWNNITREYSQEIADRYHSLTAEEKAALTNLAEWGEYSIFKDEMLDARAAAEQGVSSGFGDVEFTKTLARAYSKLGGANANLYDAFSIASDNFSEDSIKEFAVKQMNTRDYAKKAKAEGYDGVIFKNIHDNGGYSNGSEGASTVAIAFESNQIKSVANDKPTGDKDIRFSLSEAVEETKDLMALHNLKSNELLKSLELGGLPMPSIAVIKAEAGHDQYGEISLILPKEAIDPQTSRNNKVYGGDAWTPSYPRIEYKPNVAVEQKIIDKYYELAKKIGYDGVRPLYNYANGGMEDTLNHYRGEEEMIKDLYNDTKMMQVYLADTGKGKVEPVQKEIRSELSDAEVEMNEFFINELGAELVDAVMVKDGENPMAHRKQYWEEHGEKIKDTYKKLLSEKFGFTEEQVQNVIEVTKTFDYLKHVRDAYLYRKNGRVTTKTEVDTAATEDAIRNAASGGYREWIDNLFKGIEEKSGIRNNVDYFTNSGNRRSWDALHWENTLENVVRVMRQQNQTGADAIFGAHQIFAVSAKEYGSIDEIKADSDRLHKIPEAEYESIKESYSQRMLDIANRIMDKGERNQFIAVDNAMECIVDAVRSSKTKNGIYKELKQYSQLTVTEQDIDDIVSLVNDIANMPTGYFEAKPMRAVSFDEVGVFVIPRNADAKLKQELLNRGYSIAEYDPDVEGDRQKVVNSFEEYKFSLSDANEKQKRYGDLHISGEDVKLQTPANNDIAPILQETETKQADYPDGFAPIENSYTIEQEIEGMSEEYENLFEQMGVAAENGDTDTVNALQERFKELQSKESELRERANTLKAQEEADNKVYMDGLTDADAPPEIEAPYYDKTQDAAPIDPFEDRELKEVSKDRKTPAYMYENPEVKPFFQAEANVLLGEYERTEKPQTIYNGWTKYEMSYEAAQDIPEIYRTSRVASEDIAYLRDTLKMSYNDIEKGLNAIIEDNGAENIAAAKKIEFLLNDRLLYGYRDFDGYDIPPNQEYINLLTEKQIREYSEEARKSFFDNADAYDPYADIAPTEEITPVKEQYEAIRPQPTNEPRMARADTSPRGKQRKWVETSTESEVVNREILPDNLDQEAITYEPIPNKVTLNKANSKLDRLGYAKAVEYFNNQLESKKTTLEDIALGERLIQEAMKQGDTKTAGELIQNVAILGTELGQKVQALSIIQRLTPEGQLKMLQKIVNRGKAKGDKAYDGVEITQDMIDHILKTYGKDGSYDQKKLAEAVEDVKKQIADQMNVSKMDKVNAWRYLSMLGNPKTHIRNLVSNVAMKGTVAVKNAIARTIEGIAPIENRTKTWKQSTEDVKAFAKETALEMKDVLSDGSKYSEEASIKSQRQIFKNKILNGVYEFNSDLLSKEDWWFSKPAFTNALSEFLTANGINTKADIANNPKIVAKAKAYATEQAQIATFRQYSWLANEINRIERKNAATQMAVGSVLPFKKTPINIAKTGLNYSPLGFAKTLTYDIAQVKKGNMEASELIDHLSQNLTGTALTLVGYMLASAGFLNGAGDDDKEGDYDYQLGEQSYSINIGDNTYSLSWLTPVAMPLFVGANAYEQLVEGKEWNGDVVVQTLAQTLDPLSEMSFLSSLDSVLSSYDSGIEKFAGIGEAMVQNYVTQFVPTLSSQVAAVLDDTKRTTKVGADSDFRLFDETVNNLMYKIPFLREALEPTTDIWGNEIKQSENIIQRAFESSIAPYSRRENIATEIDEEIKDLFSQTGDDGVIPHIPHNYVNYDGEKYEMSAEEYTDFKKTYGQTAAELLEELFNTTMYENATSEERAEYVNEVYDYASELAKLEYLDKEGVEFTNAEKDGEEYFKENSIKGAIENNLPPDEYEYSLEYPEKYKFLKDYGVSYDQWKASDEDAKDAYDWAFKNQDKLSLVKAVADDVVEYRKYASELYDIKADKDENGKSIVGSRKEKVLDYINNMDIDYGAKLILFKNEYNADDTYNYEIIDYLNSRDDISYSEMETILKALGFTVDSYGNIYWD